MTDFPEVGSEPDIYTSQRATPGAPYVGRVSTRIGLAPRNVIHFEPKVVFDPKYIRLRAFDPKGTAFGVNSVFDPKTGPRGET